MSFHWNRPYEQNLLRRYPAETIGLNAWRTLVERLPPPSPTELPGISLDRFIEDTWKDILDGFVEDAWADAEKNGRASCCVFISHKQQDVAYAERIAYCAIKQGLDYWLDVHDPTLVLLQQVLQPGDPRLPILIAATIEIGLLNSSHVVAVHTSNSAASKWIPYEFGRAKDRRLRSTRAASWLEPTLQLPACGEYVQLAVLTHGGEGGLTKWLQQQKCRGAHTWPYPTPPVLP
jgi:hypothetical protein